MLMRGSDVELYSFHLFAGAGGGILADLLLSHRTIGAVEIDEYRRAVLLQRQLDGCLPRFPVWNDVRTFRSDNPACASYIERLRGIRDRLVINAGWPCQDISKAGTGEGLDGERSGLWSEGCRIIREIRPRFVELENSPILTSRGLGSVLGDLAEMGYNARWGCMGAAAVGADHDRERIWIFATDAAEARFQGRDCFDAIRRQIETNRMAALCPNELWANVPTPDAFGTPDGMAGRVDRLQAIGDGQVPSVAANAFRILSAAE